MCRDAQILQINAMEESKHLPGSRSLHRGTAKHVPRTWCTLPVDPTLRRDGMYRVTGRRKCAIHLGELIRCDFLRLRPLISRVLLLKLD